MGVAARRQREKEERKAAILEAAEKVFVSKGVGMATMDDIAHEAELSKGTLYLYFDSKDELYLEIAVRAVRDIVIGFERAESLPGTGYERVERILDAYVRFATQHSDRFLVAIGWMTSDPGAVASSERFGEYTRLIGEAYGKVVGAVDLGKQDGSVRDDLETTTLVSQMWGATLGVLTLQLNATQVSRRIPGNVHLESIVFSFADLLLRAIRSDEAISVGRSDHRSEVA
jgi:AcrR family transcriptional regulator